MSKQQIHSIIQLLADTRFKDIPTFYLVLVDIYKKGSVNMALTKEEKAVIVKEFAKSEKDTGATEVQIAILTEEINNLTDENEIL